MPSSTDSAISAFEGENHFLSNFHPSDVWLDGLKYPTVEHAYQAAKTDDLQRRIKVRDAATPAASKRLGRQFKCRPDWDCVKLGVMLHLLVQKFYPGTELASKLLATGDARLTEGNTWGDVFWGVCRGTGKNWLGIQLMGVRGSLRSLDEAGLKASALRLELAIGELADAMEEADAFLGG